jgi:hypothetical protein
MSVAVPPGTPAWVAGVLTAWVGQVSGVLRPVGVYVHGSLALGDFCAGRSDLDTVVVLTAPPSREQEWVLQRSHNELITHTPQAVALHAHYVSADLLRDDPGQPHPRWAHRRWDRTPLAATTRWELQQAGLALAGAPLEVALPPVSHTELARALPAEVGGYWRPKSRVPWLWLHDAWVDLGLTSAVRALVCLDTGAVISKTEAIERLPGYDVPDWVVEDLLSRRSGHPVDGASRLAVRRRLMRAVIVSRLVRRLMGQL